MTYRFIDHTADIAVEIENDSLEGLFEDAALATMETNVDLKTVNGKEEFSIELEEEDKEKLLFSFLDELIFLKDSEYALFSKFEIKINGNKLECKLYGEKIDPEKMHLNVDVKAITYHKFSVEKKDKWKAFFILDI